MPPGIGHLLGLDGHYMEALGENYLGYNIWKAKSRFKEFINSSIVDTFRNFGDIRIEDNMLITETGHKLLDKRIPKTVIEVEAVCN